MLISTNYVGRAKLGAAIWSKLALTAVLATFAIPARSADKFATYGALSIFGKHQGFAACPGIGQLVSVRLAANKSSLIPQNLEMVEGTNSLKFSFSVVPLGPVFAAGDPRLRLLPLEAWRTYPNFSAGTWDFVSVQKIAGGERLSDAIRWSPTSNSSSCSNIDSVEVIDGDLQVSTVGAPFLTSSIRVRASMSGDTAVANASVALASEPFQFEAFESLETGIDGPKTAALTDSVGSASFAVTPGTRPGIKRFIVKARGSSGASVASAMVTLAHAPVGAPVANSVPIVEYSYSSGADGKPRYLTSNAAITRQLDSRDEAKTFSRTGQVWRAFTDINAAPGLAPVCQFFGRLTSDAAVSHFFTANAQECASLRALWGDTGSPGLGLKYEGVAFYAAVPDAQQRCPAAFPIAIARYFVTGKSPYHEYLVIGATTILPAPGGGRTSEGVAFCTDVGTAFY